jgi:molybdopterin-synthase adenylyltransferase
MPLTNDEYRRYARHLLMPEIGEAGQERLFATRVLVIGAGGLGASALSYLAACGIGTIGIVDDDRVEISNLNRQIIHETGDIGRLKVESAADRLHELNPTLTILPYAERFSEENALRLIAAYDIVVDGCDNFATRYIMNRTCRQASKPWIYCAVRGWEAQLSCFQSSHSHVMPCYQCFVPESPPERHDCAERGVLGALVGVMGSIMAVEVIKIALKIGTSYEGQLLRYHALHGTWKNSRLLRDVDCAECGKTTE